MDISQKFEIQERLKKLGYYSGEVDGNLGKKSKKAIRMFQAGADLKEDGAPAWNCLRNFENSF